MKKTFVTALLFMSSALLVTSCSSSDAESAGTSSMSSATATATSRTQTQAPLTTTQVPAPVTTSKKSAGKMPAHFCSFTHYSGATYYVQYLYGQSGSASNLGICTSGNPLTEEQFIDLELTRECVLSDDKSIKQKNGIVSYYSDGSAAGVAAIQDFCN